MVDSSYPRGHPECIKFDSLEIVHILNTFVPVTHAREEIFFIPDYKIH